MWKSARQRVNEMEKSGGCGVCDIGGKWSSAPRKLDALGNDRICHHLSAFRGPIRICLSTFYFVNFVVYALFLGNHSEPASANTVLCRVA
jgi:hypothetical protein